MSDEGLRFECTGCGKCCTNRGDYAFVYVNEEETEALADLLGLTVRSFCKRYTFVDEDGWRQLSFTSERCIFLDPATNGCRVYAARPTQCRTFPFWRNMIEGGQWTEEARKLCEGVGQGRLYTIEEVETRMLEMEESDED